MKLRVTLFFKPTIFFYEKNILKSASVFVVTALLSAAVFTSCNNAGEKSNTADSSKTTNAGSVQSTPPPMPDTLRLGKDTLDHKGDQKAPPSN